MSNLLSKKSWHVSSEKNREKVNKIKSIENEKQKEQERKRKKEQSEESYEQFKKVKSNVEQVNVIDKSRKIVDTTPSTTENDIEKKKNNSVESKTVNNSKIPTFKDVLNYDSKSLFHKVVVNSQNNTEASTSKLKPEKQVTPKLSESKKKSSSTSSKSMDDLMKEYLERSKKEDEKVKKFLKEKKK